MRFLNDRDCPDQSETDDCMTMQLSKCPYEKYGCPYMHNTIPLPTENQVGEKLAEEIYNKYGDREIGCHPKKCQHNPNNNWFRGSNDRL